MIGGTSAGRALRLAIIGFACFFAAELASLLVALHAIGVTPLWIANAVLLGLVLTRGRSSGDAVALLVGGALAGVVFMAIGGMPPILRLFFPLANIIEVVVAALILRALNGGLTAFDRTRDVLSLMVACCVAPLVPAPISAIGMSLGTGTSFTSAMLSYYGAEVLSLALITPVVVITLQLWDNRRTRPLATTKAGEVALILSAVAAVAAIVFAGPDEPLLFAILPFVLVATFRLRQLGAVAAVAIVAAIGAYATSKGFGPIAGSIARPADQFLFLQFFLAVAFVSSLPVAAMLAERDARDEEARMIADHFKAVVENAGEVIFRTDVEGRWTYLNPAWATLSGYPVAASLGQPLYACVDLAEQSELAEWARPVFGGEVRATRRMLRFLTASGNLRWMELSIQALCDQDDSVIGATGTLRDIDDRKRLEEHVLTAKRRAEERARAATVLASTDELTGLANRRAFLRHLDRQSEASDEFGWRLTVAMFDVDHFKNVNDAHGHIVGDKVLQLVAARSIGVVRSGDLVGRLGGEEFGILMPGASCEDASVIAERLRQAIETAGFDNEGNLLPRVTVSIGIASQTRGQTGGVLLAAADEALYAAKGEGRNRVRVAA